MTTGFFLLEWHTLFILASVFSSMRSLSVLWYIQHLKTLRSTDKTLPVQRTEGDKFMGIFPAGTAFGYDGSPLIS